MPRFPYCFILLIVACALTAPETLAQTGSVPADRATDGDALYQTLKSMQEEMERLRKDNESMRGQIDELRARTEDNWLTEERAKQIRGLVEDVLADTDQRASLLNDGIMAGWSEHFFLADAFGRFLLQFEGLSQIRFVYNYLDRADRSRFGLENTRTQLTFRGHLYSDDFEYLVRMESTPHPQPNAGIAAGAFGLTDTWLRYHLTNDWSIRVGQFKLPFLREELVASQQQMAVERSLVNEATSIGRSTGLEFAYHDSMHAFSVVLNNGMSNRQTVLRETMGVPRINRPAIGENVEYSFTARYERLFQGAWDQFDDFTSPMGEEPGVLFGIAAHTQRNEEQFEQIIGESAPYSLSATADLSIEWGGASAFGSVTYHYVDHPQFQVFQVFGVVGQVAVYVAPKWELFLRGEFIQVENVNGGGAAAGDMTLVTLGGNYYIEGHDIKWTTDVGFAITKVSPFFASDLAGWRDANDQFLGEVVFRSQIQIVF